MALINQDDKVAFVSPSSSITEKDIKAALNWFEEKNIKVELMPHVFALYRNMGGTIAERAADINECFSRPDIKAVFCMRGGAGCLQLLDKINYENVAKASKPIFGLSDTTALQNALYVKTGNVSYTGFLPVYDFKDGSLDKQTEESLMKIFAGTEQCAKGGVCLNKGKTEGVMVGGCLSVFCSLCGTPYFPDLRDKILLLEDIGEKTYQIERMLKQISLQKGFSEIKGIVFGRFVKCVEADVGDGTVEEILQDFATSLKVPVMADFAYGHQKERYVLPIGGKVFLNADECEVRY